MVEVPAAELADAAEHDPVLPHVGRDPEHVLGRVLGLAEGALEEAVRYMRERSAFGRKIGDFQGLRWKVADMYIQIEAARGLLYRAAVSGDEFPDPTLAAKIGEPTRLLGREVRWFEYGMVNLGNITGFPAASIPCGFDSRGLPVGLQIYGRPFEEDRVLAFAQGYEQTTEWHQKRPSL